MKKILSVIIISLVLIAGNTAFVQAAGSINTRYEHAQSDGNYQARWAEVAPLLQAVRNNRTEFLRLRAEARAAYNKAKVHIRELLKNKDNLTPEQLQALKDMLGNINQDKKTLESNQGDFVRNIPGLKAARKNKNIEEAKSNLTDMNNALNTRINSLQKVVDDFNKLASI